MFAGRIDGLMGRTVSQLDDALAVAKRQRDEADMTIAAITAAIDSKQGFQDHGHRSVNGYLKQQLNCPAAEARRIKRRSRLLNQHPEIGDTLGASRIGVAQVDLLADAQQHRVAGTRFAEFAPLLIEQAEQLEYADFKAAVSHYVTQADPDGSFDDQQFREEHRNASVTDTNGAVSVHAFGGDPLQAGEMKTIFDRAVESEFHKDCDTRRSQHGDDALTQPLPRTAQQRGFDAMYEIFMASATAPSNGKRPEPLVNFVIDPTTGIDTLVRHGFLDIDIDNDNDDDDDDVPAVPVDPSTRRCSTSAGTPVHPDVVLKAMIRGSVRRVIVDAHDVTINLGRTQRLFTGSARRAAQLLAVRCGHRGCEVPAEFCDIDHIDEWATHHGGTNQANALPLCGTHDRWKHRQQLRGRRDRHGRIHLIKPDGTIIKPLNARDPDWAHPDPLAPPKPLTMTWNEWIRDNAPTAKPNAEWTVTIHDLRIV